MSSSSSNVVSLSVAARPAAAPVYGRQPAALIKLQERMLPELTALLAGVFDAADDALYELAGKAEGNGEQDAYFESMRELRLQRRNVERRMDDCVRNQFRLLCGTADTASGSFSADELSLLEKDELEEQVAVDSMVSKCMGMHAIGVTQLALRVGAALGKEIEVRENPLGPHTLCKAFAEACTPIGMDIKAKLILFKLFDRQVIAQLGRFYTTANDLLIGEGLLPQGGRASQSARRSASSSATPAQAGRSAADLNAATPAVDDQAERVFAGLQNLLSRALPRQQLDAGLDLLPRNQLMDVLAELQHNQLQAPMAAAPGAANIQDAIQAISGSRWPMAQYRVGQVEEDAINLVGMLFQFVLEDRNLAAPLKALLARLQIPMIKVAMLDKSFFSRGGHPARKLLNELATAGLGWTGGDDYERDPLYKRIENIVEKVLNDFNDDPSVFEPLLSDFLAFKEAEQRRASLVQQRLLDAEAGRAKSELARETVDTLLAEKLGDEQWPDIVLRLLQEAWSNVLFMAYLREGENSESWRNAVATVDQLLWSSRAPESDEDRKKLLALLPNLLRNLRQGLTAINHDAFQTSQLLTALEGVHLLHLRRKEAPADTSSVTNSGGDTVMARLQGALAESRRAIGKREDAPVGVEAPATTPVSADALAQVENLKLGAWLEINQGDDRRFRCRLAAVIKATGKYIFVNRGGMKVAERSRLELARELESGLITVMDDGLLFDRALASVIGNLRDMKPKV